MADDSPELMILHGLPFSVSVDMNSPMQAKNMLCGIDLQ